MLKKLLKYEMKSVGRLFLILDAAVLILAIITGLMFRGSLDMDHLNIASVIMLMIYVLLNIALVIVTATMIVQRFYQNMLCGEGYLMHTLPVPTWMHVTSKTIAAFIWIVIAGAIAMISFFLLMLIGFGNVEEVRYILQYMYEAIDVSAAWIVLLIFAGIVETVRIILAAYAAMAVGGSFYKHKVLFSFLTFIIFVIVYNVISVGLSLRSTPSVWDVFEMSVVQTSISFGSILDRMMILDLIISLIFAVAYFLIANFFLKKKLNLE